MPTAGIVQPTHPPRTQCRARFPTGQYSAKTARAGPWQTSRSFDLQPCRQVELRMSGSRREWPALEASLSLGSQLPSCVFGPSGEQRECACLLLPPPGVGRCLCITSDQQTGISCERTNRHLY